MKNKQAIEAIALKRCRFCLVDDICREDKTPRPCKLALEFGRDTFQTLISLGYARMAEQKLPSPDEWKHEDDEYIHGYSDAKRDMLSVDSEGCAYRRVYVGGKGK